MYTDQFQKEKTFALIVRLRHNVIKTGIRTISLSYSRISLRDIADKLQLDNPLDAEYIIAKVLLMGENLCNVPLMVGMSLCNVPLMEDPI